MKKPLYLLIALASIAASANGGANDGIDMQDINDTINQINNSTEKNHLLARIKDCAYHQKIGEIEQDFRVPDDWCEEDLIYLQGRTAYAVSQEELETAIKTGILNAIEETEIEKPNYRSLYEKMNSQVNQE